MQSKLFYTGMTEWPIDLKDAFYMISVTLSPSQPLRWRGRHGQFN